MQQIRIHGRGGQGVVTAAELIAIAAFNSGLYAQAFPHFGVERSGAPIKSYVRLSSEPILTREQIYQPNILIIQDHTLLDEDEIYIGMKPDTLVIINAPKNFKLSKKMPARHVHLTAATEIALKIFHKNIVNTVILGAFAKYSKLIALSDLKKAINIKFHDKGKTVIAQNIKAIEIAYQETL
jgi:pyruvate ferredoxin oxidoreductase gamma subunit